MNATDTKFRSSSVTGLVIGLIVTASTSALLGSVDASRSGVTSGTLTAFRQPEASSASPCSAPCWPGWERPPAWTRHAQSPSGSSL